MLLFVNKVLKSKTTLSNRASVKLLELGVRTPYGLFLGVWYAGGIDMRRFRTTIKPSDFGVIFGVLESIISHVTVRHICYCNVSFPLQV